MEIRWQDHFMEDSGLLRDGCTYGGVRWDQLPETVIKKLCRMTTTTTPHQICV
jgi:hypothetical protein